MTATRTGARILVDQWALQGVNQVYCVPGESFIDVLDALLDSPAIRVVVNRHESACTFMAGAYARLTGQAGVAYVTRGPGACNAAVGVHHAQQDSLPLVLFVGQTPTSFQGREALQEVDHRELFGGICKWVAQVDEAARIPEFVARAFQTATSGRPGPVVLALPEDVLARTAQAEDARCHQPVHSAPSDTQVAALRRLLGKAQRPLALAGGPGWTPSACDSLVAFAQANDLPLATAFRYQDLVDNAHPNYIGDAGVGMNPGLAERIRNADLILALGVRLGEVTTAGYRLLQPPVPRQKLVHAHAGVEELGRVYQADLLVHTGMPQLASRLSMMTPIDSPPWAAERALARADYLSWHAQDAAPAPSQAGAGARSAPDLDLRQVMVQLRRALPRDAVVCSGAGNFSAWLHRYFPFHVPGTQIAPSSGTMGYAVPAAIAAKMAAPERTVACVSGDGDFLMSAQELATAAQNNTGVLFLVFNNRMYGTIRMHQERRHPGRVCATTLANPDFAALAQAYGATGIRVLRTADFADALAQATAAIRARRLPALVELVYGDEQMLPGVSLEDLRA